MKGNRLRLVFGGVACAAALGLLAGCAETQQQKATKDYDVIRRETTPDRLQARGDASAMAGDMTRAEQYYSAALAAGGNEQLLTKRLLVVCTTDERYPAAASYAENYLRRHPGDTEVRYALATVYLVLGDLARARTALERVVAETPDLAVAHYALATVLRNEGDSLLDADHQFREYIRLSPEGEYAEAARASLLKSVP
jgi:tetratricopeptide (TPR) repeat protein